MSKSGHFSDGQRREKGPAKPNFAQTCNLLSQFMKGKGKIGDFNLGNVESVENVGVLAKSGYQPDFSTKQHQPVEDASNKACTSKETAKSEPKTAQLTIFYDGKVLVFDEYPTNQARELVSLAKKGSSKMSYGILSNSFENSSNSGVGASTSSPRQGLPPRPPVCTIPEKPVGVSLDKYKDVTNCSAAETVATSSRLEDQSSSPSEDNDSDLPIARRSSLYRFLAKRKDRAGARGPYQIQERREARPSSSKRDEELFDLNF